jgi:ABC-type transport system involved in multi-copper enzyme maturation permease subunit
MTASHFFGIVQAECIKLLSRSSARLGLLLALLIGVVAPMGFALLGSTGAVVNGALVADSLGASAPKAALWALYIRNLWLMQSFIVLLCAVSFAGELNAHTLREDLLRPVSRTAVFLAKFASVALFIVLTLTLQYATSTGLGLALFGADGPWREVFLGYVASAVSDLSFAAVVFAICTIVRSVPGTVVGMLLFIVFEKLLSWFLFVTEAIVSGLPPEMNQLPDVAYLLFQLQPMLPSAAWGLGNQMAEGAEVPLLTWAATALYFSVGALVADRVFARMDVP